MREKVRMWLIYLIRYFGRLTNYEKECVYATHAIRVQSLSAIAVKTWRTLKRTNIPCYSLMLHFPQKNKILD